jgi:hypothetical protein
MRVEWAMACRTLKMEGVDASVEGLAIDTLTIPEMPMEMDLVALARIACTADECGIEHPVEAYLMGPAMSQVVPLTFSLNIAPPGDAHPPGWEVKIFLPLIVRFTADTEGPYGLDIYIDGRFRWQVPFRVLLAPSPN